MEPGQCEVEGEPATLSSLPSPGRRHKDAPQLNTYWCSSSAARPDSAKGGGAENGLAAAATEHMSSGRWYAVNRAPANRRASPSGTRPAKAGVLAELAAALMQTPIDDGAERRRRATR